MTENNETAPVPPGPSRIPPEPPFPSPPPKSGGGGRMFIISLIVAIVVAVAVLFLVPLILGANPIDQKFKDQLLMGS